MARAHGEAESSPTRTNETEDFSRQAHQCHPPVFSRLFSRVLRLWEPLAPNRSGGTSRVATFTLPHEEENGEAPPKVPLCPCLLTSVVNSSARMSPGLYISQSVEMWALIPKTKKAAQAPASTWPDLPKLRRRQVLCNSAHCWDLAGLGL